MIQGARYVHTNIISENWEELARFYEEVFGCRRVLPERDMSGKWIEDGTGVAGAHVRGVHLRLPGYGESGPTLEIFQYSTHVRNECKNVNATGFTHIAFHVEDVEAALAEILSRGGTAVGKIVVKEIEDVGRLTFVYARDPEGNIIELQNWNRS